MSAKSHVCSFQLLFIIGLYSAVLLAHTVTRAIAPTKF